MEHLGRSYLEERRVYRLHSRNLSYGVWRPAHNDFVGIRQKWGDLFLDSEIFEHTAYPLERFDDVVVPEEISLDLHLGSIDTATGRPVAFDHPIRQGGRGWYFLDGEEEASEAIRPAAVSNKALFAFLNDLQDGS